MDGFLCFLGDWNSLPHAKQYQSRRDVGGIAIERFLVGRVKPRRDFAVLRQLDFRRQAAFSALAIALSIPEESRHQLIIREFDSPHLTGHSLAFDHFLFLPFLLYSSIINSAARRPDMYAP